jgi:hypothetical protein
VVVGQRLQPALEEAAVELRLELSRHHASNNLQQQQQECCNSINRYGLR